MVVQEDFTDFVPLEVPSAETVWGMIDRKWRSLNRVHDRMDDDYSLYKLDQWINDSDDPLSDEDIYTTNEPRVLAEKIIAFIAATQEIIAADNTDAQEQQEELNDSAEQLAIGMLNNADDHLRRNGQPSVKDQLAFFTVVRGRYAAARAVLRKRPNSDTYEDILPLDPRHLVVQPGDGELLWAAYHMRKSIEKVHEQYPGFQFAESTHEPEDTVDVWEYYSREPNPYFVPDIGGQFSGSGDPFARHPWVYMAGTIIDGKWAREPHDLFMLNFPVVLAPVSSTPELAPTDRDDQVDISFGESVFAENRDVWGQFNRATSLTMNLLGKAADPRKKVISHDGTKTLDDGSSDRGAEINLAAANNEDVENFQEADINNASALMIQQLQKDLVGGGLPPQSFGLLDTPLSSVALRQLGNNLEHRVQPRMRAVARCLEGCIENLMSQYETGAYSPITASGRRFDNHRFANRQILPMEIAGHDPVEVKMELALPEDETTRWTLAQMAMSPTATGEPLASMEYVREKILRIQSHKRMHNQNMESAAVTNSPVAQAMTMVIAAYKDGNLALAALWFDQLQTLYLQQTVNSMAMQQQMAFMAQGAQIPPIQDILSANVDFQNAMMNQGEVASSNNQALNPANGAVPFAQAAGVGNQPSPQAGFNTTAPRQRATGLVAADGQTPLTL